MRPRGIGLYPLDKSKSFSRTRCRPVSENLDLLIHRPESWVDLIGRGKLLKAVLSACKSL